jgi:hypothetical protein
MIQIDFYNTIFRCPKVVRSLEQVAKLELQISCSEYRLKWIERTEIIMNIRKNKLRIKRILIGIMITLILVGAILVIGGLVRDVVYSGGEVVN